jgi:hypothetical protein
MEVWVWEILDDSPTYPDTITGSEGTVSLTSLQTKYAGAFKCAGIITVNGSSNVVYSLTKHLSELYGLSIPKKWGVWILNATGAALNSSGHAVTRIPVQLQTV